MSKRNAPLPLRVRRPDKAQATAAHRDKEKARRQKKPALRRHRNLYSRSFHRYPFRARVRYPGRARSEEVNQVIHRKLAARGRSRITETVAAVYDRGYPESTISGAS